MELGGATRAGNRKDPHFPRIESVCLTGGWSYCLNKINAVFVLEEMCFRASVSV